MSGAGLPAPARVAGMAKCSTIDFPGTIACVVFFRGCNLDCFYCHNRQLLESGPQPGDLPWQQVVDFLHRRQGLLEGVVFSGGEPTLQPQLHRMLKEVRALGYRIKLDTNGQQPGKVRELALQGLADYVAVDWKAPPSAWPGVCGGSWERSRETILWLLEQKVPMEVRTTLYPGLGLAELQEMAGLLPPLPRWRLQYFRPPALARAQDRQRLELPALGPDALMEGAVSLAGLQPEIVFP